jgi:general secretion pathway protein M
MNNFSPPTPLPSAFAELRSQALVRWRTSSPRGRWLIAATGTLLALWLLWSIALAPALQTLQQAPGQLAALDQQLQSMQALAFQTKELRGTPGVSTAQALEALKSATTRLGEKGRITTQGDRSTLTLSGVSGEQLRAWLSEARSGARIKPLESQLTRGPKGYVGTLVVAIGNTP